MAEGARDADLALLEAWREGDGAAGERLFARHFKPIYRFFRSKLDDATAEDLTQATFTACVDGRDRFKGHSSFRTYAYAVARNQLYMHLRKKGRGEKVFSPESASVADFGPSPGTMAAAKQEQKLLFEALRRLPVQMQIAIELYYWEGLSTVELAAVLDVAEGTARSRLARAREKLGEIIEELAASPEMAKRTTAKFEDWAASLKKLLEG